MAQGEREVIQDFLTVHGFGEIFYHKHFVADFPVGPKVDIRILPAGGTHFVQLNLFQCPLTGSGLSGLGGIGAEPGDKFLQLFDLFFFFLIGFFHLFDQKLAGLIPEIIVSCVELDFSIINVCGVGADFVQKIPVVGHDNYGVGKINQKLFQPFNGIQIQVVGGLIQKQNVRIAE